MHNNMQLNLPFPSELTVKCVSERVYQDLIMKPSNLYFWEEEWTSHGIYCFWF